MKKKVRIFIAALSVALAFVMCFGLAACGEDTPPEPPEATVESITLDASGTKTVFEYGEEFTYAGLKVYAEMSDGTTVEVPSSEYKVVPPTSMTRVGSTKVVISYAGKVDRYEITIKERYMPPISATSLVDIEGENADVAYRVEAEDIDMEISDAKLQGGASFVEEQDGESSVVTSGNAYLDHFGVKGNYFGFTFTSDQDYDGVIIVLRLAYAAEGETLPLADNMIAYLNYKTVAETGEIPLDGVTVAGPAAIDTVTDEETGESVTVYEAAPAWRDVLLRDVSVAEGTNTLTFEITGENTPMIDYIDFYVGKRYVNSIVNMTEQAVYDIEFEEFDLEKIVNRQDMIDYWHLQPGQCFLETPTGDATAHGENGKSAAGFMAPTEISTTLRLSNRATIAPTMIAASTSSYRVAEKWEFYVDGIRLTGVESVDIKAGDAQKGLYWEWRETALGWIDLEAGDHTFTAKLIGSGCNTDYFRFEVLSWGSFEEHPDPSKVQIKSQDTYRFEAENLDTTNAVLRSDLYNHANRVGNVLIENGTNASGKCIGGFTTDSYFEIPVSVGQDATVKITMVAAHNLHCVLNQSFAFELDGNPIDVSDHDYLGKVEPAYWDWSEGLVAYVDFTAGQHVLKMSVLSPNVANIDYFDFEVISYGEFTHVCQSVCPICGKCTDPDCEEAACAEKCEGHETPGDVTIEAIGTYVLEAETLDNAGVISRTDFVQGGRIADGEYYVETAAGASGGKAINGFVSGTTFTFTVRTAETCALELQFVGVHGNDFDCVANIVWTLDGDDLAWSGESVNLRGTAYPEWNDWKTVSVNTVTLDAGLHTFVLNFAGGGVDAFDCLNFVVTSFGSATA